MHDDIQNAMNQARPLIRQALLDWYRAGHRQLPWRCDRDPYRILISEMMLVQTTAAAVEPYFIRFLQRFPTLADLATAPLEAVLKAWEGLGYYRRARQLHAAAIAIHTQHAGNVPRQRVVLEALPGIGPYIAGAILSFAFDQPEPILEANSQRVLARLIGWPEELQRADSRKTLWQVARSLVEGDHPGEFNQALIELGATLCAPRQPRCLVCPWAGFCRAKARGEQEIIPRSAKRPVPQVIREECILAVREDSVLIVQRPEDAGLWAGLWEFPTMHCSGPDPAGRAEAGSTCLQDLAGRLSGERLILGSKLLSVKYVVTRYRVTLDVRLALVLPGHGKTPTRLHRQARWARFDELNQHVWGSAGRKVIQWLGDPRGRAALDTALESLRKQRIPSEPLNHSSS
jgi:A/G-specific adenine glycosylase